MEIENEILAKYIKFAESPMVGFVWVTLGFGTDCSADCMIAVT